MKMGIRCVATIFLPLLLSLGSGCATKALWENENLEAVKEPANPVNLRLFHATRRNDLLVIYDEYSERSDGVRTRAYWLNENQARLAKKHAPHFTSTNLITRQLSPVPIFHSTPGETNWTFALYAVVETNRQSFTLFYKNGNLSRHDLPTYNDGKGPIEKIALTPVAVTADVTIAAGFFGYWYLQGLGESDGDAWPFSH